MGYPRHENFEVVLDPTNYSTKNDFDDKVDVDGQRAKGSTVDDAVLEIQRDLEGFERQMKQESKEEKQQEAQPERKQEAAVGSSSPDTSPENSPSLLDRGNQESPLSAVEVAVEEPPAVKISVETQPALCESKP